MAPEPSHSSRVRDAVRALIQQLPGITQRSLQDRLGVAWGTVAHHVRSLREEGGVEVEESHRRRSLFAPDVPAHLRPGLAVLRQDPVEMVHRYLSSTGRSREYEVADALGISRRAARRALQKMHDVGLVQRRGQHTALYEALPLHHGPAALAVPDGPGLTVPDGPGLTVPAGPGSPGASGSPGGPAEPHLEAPVPA